ncbi:OmpA family protein [Comamonas sp. Y33R10-2]|uniref:YidB family protein n=1 Tax=Comamonas sp. Y33R10-2 TaxID=2853257 RepID=UPI001C5CBABA|nr:YidB family protein [Comamonas sp. Y33R10-2]QXZ10064.1 OmpA family protein [Comamonas sp. Y33R10-2]
MFENVISEVGSRLGLGDQAKPLVQMLAGYIANPATGGLSGFLNKFRNAGLGTMVQSWLGDSSSPQAPSNEQLQNILGEKEGLLDKISARTGLPLDRVATAISALLPMLISRLTPGGTIPTVLPTEFASFASQGQSLMGMVTGGLGAAAAGVGATAAAVGAGAAHAGHTARETVSSAAAAVPAESSGIAKWLPWLIGALVVIFGISYCSKQKTDVPAPAPAAVPAPVTPEPTPTPVPEPTPAPAATAPDTSAPAASTAATPASDSFTAPVGAGILDGMLQDTPLLRVFFDSGKVEVAAEFAEKVKPMVAFLQANPDVKAVVSGFNDPTGDAVKNAELSKKRAQAVQAALVMAGVPQDRTVLEKPAETTDTAATNAASRRVDVMLRK